MIGIRKNHHLVTIGTLASIFLVNAMSIGTGGHFALARHHDIIKAFENGGINVQTDTNQGQACETASGSSPISDSCTASSSNTISQGGGVVQSTQRPTSPTVLTLKISPTTISINISPILTGTLTDTSTGSGVGGATITFTGTANPGVSAVTVAAGSYFTPVPNGFVTHPGTYTIQAHFAGQGIFGPSDSPTETLTVH